MPKVTLKLVRPNDAGCAAFAAFRSTFRRMAMVLTLVSAALYWIMIVAPKLLRGPSGIVPAIAILVGTYLYYRSVAARRVSSEMTGTGLYGEDGRSWAWLGLLLVYTGTAILWTSLVRTGELSSSLPFSFSVLPVGFYWGFLALFARLATALSLRRSVALVTSRDGLTAAYPLLAVSRRVQRVARRLESAEDWTSLLSLSQGAGDQIAALRYAIKLSDRETIRELCLMPEEADRKAEILSKTGFRADLLIVFAVGDVSPVGYLLEGDGTDDALEEAASALREAPQQIRLGQIALNSRCFELAERLFRTTESHADMLDLLEIQGRFEEGVAYAAGVARDFQRAGELAAKAEHHRSAAIPYYWRLWSDQPGVVFPTHHVPPLRSIMPSCRGEEPGLVSGCFQRTTAYQGLRLVLGGNYDDVMDEIGQDVLLDRMSRILIATERDPSLDAGCGFRYFYLPVQRCEAFTQPDPDSDVAVCLLYLARIWDGDLDEAHEILGAAQAERSTSALLACNWATHLEIRGEYDKAMEAVRRAAHLVAAEDSGLAVVIALELLELLVVAGCDPSAWQDFTSLYLKFKACPIFAFFVAAEGRTADAAKMADVALVLDELPGLFHWLRAVCELEEVRLHEAREHALSAVQTDESNPFYNLIAGLATLRSNHYQEAGQYLEKSLDLGFRSETALAHAGLVAQKTGRQAKAEALFQEALEVNPDAARAWGVPGLLREVREAIERARCDAMERARRDAMERARRDAIALASHAPGRAAQQPMTAEEHRRDIEIRKVGLFESHEREGRDF